MLVEETSVIFAFCCSSSMVSAPAVAHRVLDLAERQIDIILQRAGVWHIGVHAFYERKLVGAAMS